MKIITTGGVGHPQQGQVISDIDVPDGPRAPLSLSATAFQDVCEAGLGGGSTGRARFGAIIRAMETSADDEVRGVFKRFDKSITFDKPKAAGLLSILVSKSVAGLTPQERLAILAAWPEGNAV